MCAGRRGCDALPVIMAYILLKEKYGKRKSGGAARLVSEGEILERIPEREVRLGDENYRLYSDSNVVLFVEDVVNDISLLRKVAADFLLAVQPASVRIQEYQNKKKMNDIKELGLRDVVIVNINNALDGCIHVHGRIRYIGTRPGQKGTFFGIDITLDKRHCGKGNTDGSPHFNCGRNNAVYVAMDKIVQKSSYGEKEFNEEEIVTAGGRPRSMSQFKTDVRVVLQSVDEEAIHGTVRWVGRVRVDSQYITAVGIETDQKIDVSKKFPDVHLPSCTEGLGSFTVSTQHSRVYLPEELVVSAEDHKEQNRRKTEQEQAAQQHHVSIFELCAQKDLFDEVSKSISKDVKDGAEKKTDKWESRYHPLSLPNLQKSKDDEDREQAKQFGISLHEYRAQQRLWNDHEVKRSDPSASGVVSQGSLQTSLPVIAPVAKRRSLPPRLPSFPVYQNLIPSNFTEPDLIPKLDSLMEEEPVTEKNSFCEEQDEKEQSVWELVTETQQERESKQIDQLLTEKEQLSEENRRLSAENNRLLPENRRLSAENNRLLPENRRLSAENNRLLPENRRLTAENNQLLPENRRLSAENNRLLAENRRLSAEKDQLSDENEQLLGQLRDYQQGRATASAIEESWKISHTDITLTDQVLGNGGWGEVKIGIFHQQKIAVKRLHDTIVSDNNLQQMNREINTMAKLRHPNLLQFIGAVFDHPSGHPMIITELMETSLRDAYEKKKFLNSTPGLRPVILSIMKDVAIGLNYLHTLSEPIIHRDVSSANVLLESRGLRKWKTKISDFGSAKIARNAVTQAAGTFVYSAPESSLKQNILSFDVTKQTPKMDVYSFGVLLCEMLTCQFPQQESFRGMLQEVHPPFHDFIMRCIKDDPNNRPTMEYIIGFLS